VRSWSARFAEHENVKRIPHFGVGPDGHAA
jgi:hypothetical protein